MLQANIQLRVVTCAFLSVGYFWKGSDYVMKCHLPFCKQRHKVFNPWEKYDLPKLGNRWVRVIATYGNLASLKDMLLIFQNNVITSLLTRLYRDIYITIMSDNVNLRYLNISLSMYIFIHTNIFTCNSLCVTCDSWTSVTQTAISRT